MAVGRLKGGVRSSHALPRSSSEKGERKAAPASKREASTGSVATRSSAKKAAPTKPEANKASQPNQRPAEARVQRAHGNLLAPGWVAPAAPLAPPAVPSGFSQLFGGARTLWEDFWGGRDRPATLTASPQNKEGGKEVAPPKTDSAESAVKERWTNEVKRKFFRGEISEVTVDDLPAILKFSEVASAINLKKRGFSYGMRWYEDAKNTLVYNPNDLKSQATHTLKWVRRGYRKKVGDEASVPPIVGMISMVQPAVRLKAMGLIVTKIESIQPGVGRELILRAVQESIDAPPDGGGNLLVIVPHHVDKTTGAYFRKLGFRKRSKIAGPNVLEFAPGGNVYHLSLTAANKLIERAAETD